MRSPSLVAAEAVRIAKRLAVRGCQVTKFRVSPYGSCYVVAKVMGVKFCVRVADHFRSIPSRPGNLFHVRVDQPGRGTPIPLGVWVDRVAMSRFDDDRCGG